MSIKFSQALALMREAFEDAQTGSAFIPCVDLAAVVDLDPSPARVLFLLAGGILGDP